MWRSSFPGMVCALALAVAACKPAEPPVPKAVAGPLVAPEAGELPDAVLGWAMAGDLRGLIQRGEAFAGQAAPVPQGALGMQLQAGLSALGLKDTSVIDLGAPMAVALLDPKRFPQAPWVLALSTKGQAAVVQSLAPAWTQAAPAEAPKDGVLELGRETVDTGAVFQGGGAKPAAQRTSLFLRFRGPLAEVAMSREALLAAAPLLEARLDAGAPADGVVGGLRLDALRKVFQAELGMLPAAAKAQLEMGMQAQGAAAPFSDPKRAAATLGMFVDKAFSTLQQIREVGFAVGVTADAGTFSVALGPEAGSFFQTLLAAQRPAAFGPLLAGLPQDAFMAAALDIQWKSFEADLVAFGETIFQAFYATPLAPEVTAAMKEMISLIGEQVVFAEMLDPAGGIQVVEIFTVQKEARFLEVMTTLMKAMGPLMDQVGAGAGLRMSLDGPKDLGKAGEAALLGWDFVLDLTALPPPQAAAFRQIYGGDRMRMGLASTGGKAFLAIGPKPEALLAEMLGRMQAKGDGGLAGSAAFRSAAGGTEQGAGGWFFLSMTRMFAWTMQQTQAMLGTQAPLPTLPPARSGVFFRLGQERGRLQLTLRMPGEHLKELGEAFRALSQGSAPPPPPPPAPAAPEAGAR